MGDVVVSWFYEQNGNRKGPFTPNEIAALIRAGAVNEHTLLWSESLSEWTPLFRTELRSLIGDKVIQPPPSPSSAPRSSSAAPPPPVWDPPGQTAVHSSSSPSFTQHASAAAPPPPVWDSQIAVSAQGAYGGFWIRAVAYTIDSIVLVAAIFILALILIAGGTTSEDAEGLLSLVAVGFFWLYFALMESSERGATLGKMAMGLRVVSNDGQRISFMNATGRTFAKFVSSLILNIGFFMVGFTDRKRGLHDMMASTLVIKVH